MRNIENLLENHGWDLGVATYRYGGGFFVFATPSDEYVRFFGELAYMPGDIAAMDFYEYVAEEGSWLPIVYSSTLEKGLYHLNEKLSNPITITSEWRNKVELAYHTIEAVADNS